jgi:hypothetical protein
VVFCNLVFAIILFKTFIVSKCAPPSFESECLDDMLCAGDMAEEAMPAPKRSMASFSMASFSRRSQIEPEAERLRIISPEELAKAEIERIRTTYASKREELQKRRVALDAERVVLEGSRAVGASPVNKQVVHVDGSLGRDYSVIPTQLDSRLETEDPDGALRPTIINVSKQWNKRSQRTLLSPSIEAVLSVAEQKLEKNTCWDLLDALTRSGGMPIEDAMLHIVVASTHCFENSVIDTLVKVSERGGGGCVVFCC